MPQDNRVQLLPGTLEMLVLQTLAFGRRHGHGIATTIQRTSGEVLLVARVPFTLPSNGWNERG